MLACAALKWKLCAVLPVSCVQDIRSISSRIAVEVIKVGQSAGMAGIAVASF